METLQHINALKAENRIPEALKLLDSALAAEPDNHDLLVERGRLRWRMGDRGGALTDYNHAARLRPDGPAAALIRHTNDILDFYNPDMLNP